METLLVLLLALFVNWVTLMLIPLLFIGVSILLIKQLSDDPNNPNKPYFFTAVEPGRIKAVMRGGKVRRYLMNFGDHHFPWEVRKDYKESNRDELWDVKTLSDLKKMKMFKGINVEKELEEKYAEFNFWQFIFWFWPANFFNVFDWCLGYIYDKTGHKFTGIWPFQVLEIRQFTRKIQKRDEQGNPVNDENGLPVLVDSLERTDHVRARSFVWRGRGQTGETKEGLKIQVTWVANVYTTNPQKALFGTDRWDVVLTSTLLRTLASNIRTMAVNQILTATKASKEKLATTIQEEAARELEQYGFAVESFQIIDFSPMFSEEDQKALTAKWRAERNKEASRIEGEGRGQGRAAEITKVAQAIKNGGVAAKRAQELEAQIATAKAVGDGGGVAIIGGQTAGDGTQAAILAELRKLNKGK